MRVSIFKFSHPLIRGLRGSCPNLSILSTFLIEIHYYIVHHCSDIKQWDGWLKEFLKSSHLLISD